MLYLNVPYVEKDEAKKLGAKWDAAKKKWYVANKEDYPKFFKWIFEEGEVIVCDWIYIMEGVHTCFKCKKQTKVIQFGVENYYILDCYDNETETDITCEYNSDIIRMAGIISNIPDYMLKYIKSNYNFKMKYSQTTNETLLNNCCENCDSLQGRFFLFQEVDSPFWLDSETSAKQLTLYKIPLKYDIIVSCDLAYSTFDETIKEEATIKNLIL